MNEEKKDGKECCGTGHRCCGPKKLIVVILLGLLFFGAGVLFAKTKCGGPQMCPIPQGQMIQK